MEDFSNTVDETERGMPEEDPRLDEWQESMGVDSY